METTGDRLRAVAFALGVHAFALALLFVGLWWQQPIPATDAQGPMVEATLVRSPQQSAAIAKAIASAEKQAAQRDDHDAIPPPQPKPEPKPQDAPQPQQIAPQASLPKPDTVDQDEVRRLADQAAAQKLQEQEERRKQAQVDLTNQQKQQQEAENRQRLAQQELDRLKLLENIRKQRADAERQVKLQAQKLKQLQDQRAQLAQNDAPPASVAQPTPPRPPLGSGHEGMEMQGRYIKAIKDVALQNWRTGNAPGHVVCKAHIKQLPGGEVFDVSFPDCPYDAAGRQSVEDAFKRTPLPYAGYESVYLREFNIEMCYPEDSCK